MEMLSWAESVLHTAAKGTSTDRMLHRISTQSRSARMLTRVPWKVYVPWSQLPAVLLAANADMDAIPLSFLTDAIGMDKTDLATPRAQRALKQMFGESIQPEHVTMLLRPEYNTVFALFSKYAAATRMTRQGEPRMMLDEWLAFTAIEQSDVDEEHAVEIFRACCRAEVAWAGKEATRKKVQPHA